MGLVTVYLNIVMCAVPVYLPQQSRLPPLTALQNFEDSYCADCRQNIIYKGLKIRGPMYKPCIS